MVLAHVWLSCQERSSHHKRRLARRTCVAECRLLDWRCVGWATVLFHVDLVADTDDYDKLHEEGRFPLIEGLYSTNKLKALRTELTDMVLLTCECRLKRTSVQQIECTRGWQCAGFQWYHVKCVLDEGDEQSLEEFEFLCSHCQDAAGADE